MSAYEEFERDVQAIEHENAQKVKEMADDVNKYISRYNRKPLIPIKLKKLVPLEANELSLTVRIFHPNEMYYSSNSYGNIVYLFDNIAGDHVYRNIFVEAVIPEGVKVSDIELLDLIWVVNNFKSKAKDYDNAIEIIRKVYNSSSSALNRHFGTSDRVACVVESLTRYSAIDYLEYKGRVDTALNQFGIAGLYLCFKYYLTTIPDFGNYDDPSVLIKCPSLLIKENNFEGRGLILRLNEHDDESIEKAAKHFKMNSELLKDDLEWENYMNILNGLTYDVLHKE